MRRRSLGGSTVLLPRAERPGHRDRLAEALSAAGAQVVRIPLTRTRPADPGALATALGQLAAGEYRWVVITSPRTLDALGRSAPSRGETVPSSSSPQASRPDHPLTAALRAARASTTRVAAVGQASAQALSEVGLEADVVAAGSSEALLREGALTEMVPAGGRLLLPCSRLSPPDLAEGLRRAGWQVERVSAYDTVPVPVETLPATMGEDWGRGGFDAVVLTSASTCHAASTLLGPPHPDTRLVALGDASARAASTFLRSPDAVADAPTPSALVEAVRAALHNPSSRPHPDQEIP